MFCHVVEQGHFIAAANVLRQSKSSFSGAVQRLQAVDSTFKPHFSAGRFVAMGHGVGLMAAGTPETSTPGAH